MGENSTPEGSRSGNSAAPTLRGSEDETLVGDARERDPQPGPLPRGTTIGRYVVLEVLGAGGMGVVYAAFDPQLDRRLALKVLRPDPEGSSGSHGGPERLLREAQAMARLSHPNVIAVHDVGTFEGEVFVAMEFVDGCTLSAWLEQGKRSWREVVRVFREAGAGLAAAHRAGIVHRDFKPDNVMLSSDGRVYVLDFGLARPHGPTQGPATTEVHRTEDDARSVSIDTRLTQTGALLGTPAYMAPEQHTGDDTCAESDQFSFCVALYEGLYGERPFRGDSTASLAFNVLQGKIKEAPADAKVPRWLRRLVVRGLSTKKAARWPSMDALLGELSRDPQAKRRRWLTAGGAALIVAAGAYAYGSAGKRDDTVCQAAQEHLDGVWDDETRAAVKLAFEATGKPYAAEAYEKTRQALDAYAGNWTSTHLDACEATRIRGEQSERMLDLRMSCLEQRRHQLAAASKLLANADEQVLQRAHQITAGLPAVGPCSDIERLNDGADPPDAAVIEHVDAARAALGEVAALVDAGKYDQALESVRPALEAATATDYAPVIAEANFWLGYTLEKTGDPDAGVEALSDAAFGAQAARHDAVAARAMTVLVFVVGDRLARIDDGMDWARHARAAVSRLDDPLAEAELLNNEGIVLTSAGRYAEAQDRFEQALARREQALGSDHFIVGRTLNNLATVLDEQGKYDEASAIYGRALALAEATVGADHPDLGIRLTNFGEMLARTGDPETARRHLERARTIFADTVGKSHHYYASATNNLATLEVADGNLEVALRLMQETKGIWVELLGPEHPEVAIVELNIGGIAHKLGWHDEAMVHLEVSLQIYRKAFGPEHRDVASVLISLATVLGEAGDHERALEHNRTAVEILEKHVEAHHPELGSAHKGVGLELLALGKPDEAIPSLERAVEIAEKNAGEPDDLADLRSDLAQARREAAR